MMAALAAAIRRGVFSIGVLPLLFGLPNCVHQRMRPVHGLAISSNLHPAGFDELMPKTLATAMVDRLMHHAHVCQTAGDSVRLAQAVSGAGVKALGDGAGPPARPAPRRRGGGGGA